MPSPSDKIWESKGKQVLISVLRIAIELKLLDFFFFFKKKECEHGKRAEKHKIQS